MMTNKLAVQFTMMIFILMLCLPKLSHADSSESALVNLVMDFYTAYQSRDVERMTELTSKEVVWEAQRSLPTGGTFVGIDEVVSNVFDKTAFYIPGFRSKW